MSEQTPPAAPSSGPITLDDLRHKALAIRAEVQEEVREQVTEKRTRLVTVAAIALVAIVSLAYLAGSRAGRRAGETPPV
jgi:hypothetical protein